MTVGTVSLESAPRDLEGLLAQKPSVRFRLMLQLNALTSMEDRKAFSGAGPQDQAQRLLAAIQEYDASGGGGQHQKVPQPPPQALVASPTQMGKPSMGAPNMNGPGMNGPSMGAAAAPPAKAASPEPTVPQPSFMMPGRSEPEGMPLPPQKQASLNFDAQQPTENSSDPEGPDEDILQAVLTNQHTILDSIESLGHAVSHLARALDQLQGHVTSDTRANNITLLVLLAIYEQGMGQSRSNLIQGLQTSLMSGEYNEFISEVLNLEGEGQR